MAQRYTPLVNSEGRAQLYASPDGAFVTYDDHVSEIANEVSARDEMHAESNRMSFGNGYEQAMTVALAALESLPHESACVGGDPASCCLRAVAISTIQGLPARP